MLMPEKEVFDRLCSNLRLAAEKADILVRSPRKGLVYDEFRKALAQVENMCRFAAYYREDARWLAIGMAVERAHQNGGHWLRSKQSPKLFGKMAEFLRNSLRSIEKMRDAATGVLGMILPPVQRLDREHRPQRVLLPTETVTRGGLILPGAA